MVYDTRGAGRVPAESLYDESKGHRRKWAPPVWQSGVCCIFLGNRSPRGYGSVKVGGRMLSVTRLMLSWKLGRPLQREEHACHTCDTPACINPEHLWAGSQRDNIRDAACKGRMRTAQMVRWGSSNHMARLTMEQAQQIRDRTVSVKFAIEVWGISITHAYEVRKGATWHFREGIPAHLLS